MSITRHFIGWDRPPVQSIAEYLLPDDMTSGPVDFADLLVVVPTRQAGRNLRELLAWRGTQRDAAILSLHTVTPASFLHPEVETRAIADETTVRALWAQTLQTVDPEAHAAFLCSTPTRDFAWAMQTAEILQNLRGDLSEGSMLIRDVVDRYAAQLEEPDRWRDMARIEKSYLQKLDTMGLMDPIAARIGYAERAQLPAGVSRVVMACVPDPPPVVIQAIDRIHAGIEVDILIAAPESEVALFDEWGRPLGPAWKHSTIEPVEPNRNLILSSSPPGQCRTIIQEIAGDPEQPAPADIAIGVPDRSIVPFLISALADHGVPAFDPADKQLVDHPLYHLLALLSDLLSQRSYRAFSSFVRHPDMLRLLTQSPRKLLLQLDTFQNTHLPLSFDAVHHRLTDPAALPGMAREYPDLASATQQVRAFLASFTAARFPNAIRAFLQSTYKSRLLKAGVALDDEFAHAAKLVNEVTRELESDTFHALQLSAEDAATVFIRRLSEQSYHREQEKEGIDLLGWLELAWTDAPYLFVTGMNEGFVPDSRMGDSFLPDSLRRLLGLRNDETRLARDAFLMTLCIESRRQNGRCCFVAGKTTNAGDPLKPSRLLFRCSDEDLPARAAQLFGDVTDSRPALPATIAFQLTPQPPTFAETLPIPTKLSVTSFSRYLTCPFRFYLSHILEMQEMDDRKRDMDALDFGSMIHEVLEDMASGPALACCEDESLLAEFLVSTTHDWFIRRYGSRLATPLLVSLNSACERLKSFARAQAALAQEGWQIVAHEQKLEMTIGGIVVRGKIDRIDQHRETGRLRLIDYKTSDTAQAPASTHLGSVRDNTPPYAVLTMGDKERRWIDLQLPLYYHLHRLQSPDTIDVELAYFNLPKAITHTALDVWEGCSTQLLGSAHDCAAAIVDQIKACVYWPPSEHINYDDFELLGCGRELAEVFLPLVTPESTATQGNAQTDGNGGRIA